MVRAELNVALAETLHQLARMPAFLAGALERGAGRLAEPPAAGGFSLVEHACHLRDLEREGYLVRVQRLLDSPGAKLESFHGDRVAEERSYRTQDAGAAARDFALLRSELVRIVSSLSPEDLRREGIFVVKPVTLEQVVAMAAGHDAEHRADIDKLLAEIC